jgi:ABC-type polysaccharide/polyol phosphate transport system ATPase subunit
VASIFLKNVGVDIPIFDVKTASLKKALLGRTIGGPFARSGAHLTVSALKNFDFEAHDGDRIALVGDNGAGKSTLLRVVSHVYPPTSGMVHVVGKVSPMFDTTLGMSMDATGMENIQIAGTIWGMSRAQIRNSTDDIVEFTELGDFLKVPVRTYSNGMLLRLAFAIATIRDPEILLIDEAIGVAIPASSRKHSPACCSSSSGRASWWSLPIRTTRCAACATRRPGSATATSWLMAKSRAC